MCVEEKNEEGRGRSTRVFATVLPCSPHSSQPPPSVLPSFLPSLFHFTSLVTGRDALAELDNEQAAALEKPSEDVPLKMRLWQKMNREGKENERAMVDSFMESSRQKRLLAAGNSGGGEGGEGGSSGGGGVFRSKVEAEESAAASRAAAMRGAVGGGGGGGSSSSSSSSSSAPVIAVFDDSDDEGSEWGVS